MTLKHRPSLPVSATFEKSIQHSKLKSLRRTCMLNDRLHRLYVVGGYAAEHRYTHWNLPSHGALYRDQYVATMSH